MYLKITLACARLRLPRYYTALFSCTGTECINLLVVSCSLCCVFHCVTSERQQLYDLLAPVRTWWARLRSKKKKLEKISEFGSLCLCIDNLIKCVHTTKLLWCGSEPFFKIWGVGPFRFHTGKIHLWWTPKWSQHHTALINFAIESFFSLQWYH